MNRRRFLTITAAALAAPRGAMAARWEGRAFGTAVALRLDGADPSRAALTFARVAAELARVEGLFSLHRESALTRLNRDGRLAGPPDALRDILSLAVRVHAATGGAFDPTVQPLWLATAMGGDTGAARAAVGLDRVQVDDAEIRLGRGQQLTFNGIAQGWAADRIAALLAAEGYGNALIDMGEIATTGPRADGRPWRAGVVGPDGEALGKALLAGRALATSSPRGTLIGAGAPHILGPQGQAVRWRTASVSADRAALADALSTAFCLMDRPAIDAALAAFPGAALAALA